MYSSLVYGYLGLSKVVYPPARWVLLNFVRGFSEFLLLILASASFLFLPSFFLHSPSFLLLPSFSFLPSRPFLIVLLVLLLDSLWLQWTSSDRNCQLQLTAHDRMGIAGPQLSQYYSVLQRLHKVHPTTLYYKACTKQVPVLFWTTKSPYYFVLQSLHKIFPS